MDEDDVTDFWRRLREFTPDMDDTERSKLVQRVCGVRQATASRWKTGGASGADGPSPRHAKMLCAELNASFDYLYNGDDTSGKLVLVPGSRSEQGALILNSLSDEDQARAVAILRAMREPELQSS